MKSLLRWAGAIALALMPSVAPAQAPVGKSIQAPSGYLPSEAIYCDDGTGHAVLCNFGTSAVFSRVAYVATASGTGYASGDQIARLVTTNPSTGAVVAAYWVNVTQGTLLSTAPSLSNLSQIPVTIINTDFGMDCTVVSGDQAYTVGSTQRCTMTASGRVKVGLSSATNIDPGAQAATTLGADLVACKYNAAGVSFADTNTGAIRCGSDGRLLVGTTLPVITVASSTPLTFSTTTTTTIGPWSMQLGRSYVIAFAITGGTASIAVTTTTDGVCADSYQLSSANATYIRGAFTNVAVGRYRENLGSETQVGAQLCATITPVSGATVTGSISQ